MKRTRTIIVPLLVLLIAALFVSCEPTADIQGGGGDSGNKRVIKVYADSDIWLSNYRWHPYDNMTYDLIFHRATLGYWETDKGESNTYWTLDDIDKIEYENKSKAPRYAFSGGARLICNDRNSAGITIKPIIKEGRFNGEDVVFELYVPVFFFELTPDSDYISEDEQDNTDITSKCNQYRGFAKWMPEAMQKILDGEDIYGQWSLYENDERDYQNTLIAKHQSREDFNLELVTADDVEFDTTSMYYEDWFFQNGNIKTTQLLGKWSYKDVQFDGNNVGYNPKWMLKNPPVQN